MFSARTSLTLAKPWRTKRNSPLADRCLRVFMARISRGELRKTVAGSASGLSGLHLLHRLFTKTALEYSRFRRDFSNRELLVRRGLFIFSKDEDKWFCLI